MSLDYKIKQNISLGAPAISRQGFGTVLVLGSATFTERVKFYAPDDDYASDPGLTSGLIEALSTAFAQSPAPTKVAVGRRDADQAQVVDFTVAGATSGDFEITINGNVYSYTASGIDSDSDIATALQPLVDADADVTATVAAAVVTVTADIAGEAFSYSTSAPSGGSITAAVTTPNVSLATELDACAAASSEWFGLCVDSRTDADILDAAQWAEGHGRLFFAQSNDADAPTSSTGDIASQLKALNYTMTALAYYSDDAVYFDVGWMAGFLAWSFDQTAPTAVYNTVEGVATDVDNTSEQTYLEGKNANYYSTLKGVGATFGGTVADGHDIEHIVTGQWVKARLSEKIAKLFLDASARGERIPFNDQGIAAFEQATFDVLKLGERIGHFNPGTSAVDMPLRSEIADADLYQGLLRYSWGAQYSGVIKEVSIQGYVSLDFEGFEEA